MKVFLFYKDILDYADVVWDDCSADLQNEIENVKDNASRNVSGAIKPCSIHNLLTELRREPTCHQAQKQKRTLMHFKPLVHFMTFSYTKNRTDTI